jgi:hypothetical protein
MAKARALTADEAKDKFLTRVSGYVDYWATLPGKTQRERLEGLAFSLMAILDGGASDLPGFTVKPRPHESDKEYYTERGENYFSKTTDIAGSLHESIHSYFYFRRER